jgi:sigma-54 dependent transcriptional regulator, acetoin dehydrogenase operon transcriptional activator AcoR
MNKIKAFLDNKTFLKTLFHAIPCGVLLLDHDRRIYAANDFFLKAYETSGDAAFSKRPGDAIGCIIALRTSEGCGFAEECNACAVRNTALQAISGNVIQRKRVQMELQVNGKAKAVTFQITAAPFEHDGKRMAIVMFEDISELNKLRTQLKTEQSFNGIIGSDVRMLELFETVRDVSDVDVPVLIQGESGTGKELVAAAIHNEGPRSGRLFVPVNCAALPEGLLESELFGHVKGAFTGAIRDKKGRFELADGGTLFLDEVGELPQTVQVKLLRVLQEGTFERVGGEKNTSVNVRLVSATNKDLAKEVAKGTFRKDLYYRIRVVPINIPALRERKDDIPLLVDHFLRNTSREGYEVKGISKEALALMVDYSWPGNVRELQSAIRFALIMSKGEVVRREHLPAELREWVSQSRTRGPSRKLDQDRVSAALKKADGNKAKAARLLEVGRATLYRFLDEHPDIKSE